MAAMDRSATPTSATAAELTGVVKTYRRRVRSSTVGGALRALWKPEHVEIRALDGVDLSIERSETVAYAGPNGAGKSTTVKLLAGILSPDKGSVRVLGLDPVADRRRHVGRIGVVFGQRSEIWIDHPVESSFEWKRVVWDIPDDTYRRMLGTLTELLDLTDIRPALARQLSLGQRMRAELAMALLHEPELLLLDEPTIGLDVLGKRQVLSFVRELAASGRVTTVVTSHDMADLEFLAERIVLLDHGRISFDGDFAALRAASAPRRVLVLETSGTTAPALPNAELVRSDHGRHQYLYDPRRTTIAALLEAASAAGEVLDVETHRPDIDEVVADLYASWKESPGGRGPSSGP
jgi:ABC-2 type transport system ATP-binding protein